MKDLDITPAIYQQMEGLRKSYVGEDMKKEEALDLIKAMGLPTDSPKLWGLLFKYQVLIKKGNRRYTKYRVPQDMYSKKTLDKMEYEYYNGRVPKKKKEPRVKDQETGRTLLTPSFCANYLMQRGYVVFKLSPNLVKLKKIFTLQFLMESMEAEMVLPTGQSPDM